MSLPQKNNPAPDTASATMPDPRLPVLMIVRWSGHEPADWRWLKHWAEHYLNQDYPVVLGLVGGDLSVASALEQIGIPVQVAIATGKLTESVTQALIQTLVCAVPQAAWVGITMVEEHVDFARAGGLAHILSDAHVKGFTAIFAERWDRISLSGSLIPLGELDTPDKHYPLACALTSRLSSLPSRHQVLWRLNRRNDSTGWRDSAIAQPPIITWRYGWDHLAQERLESLAGAQKISSADGSDKDRHQTWEKNVNQGKISLANLYHWEPDARIYREQDDRRHMAAISGKLGIVTPPGRPLNLETDMPLRFFINVHSDELRRFEFLNHLKQHNLDKVERFPGLDKHWVRDHRGHWDAGRYALSLTQKRILREARRRRAPAVLIFEDDVLLDDAFTTKAAALHLPDDWGLFYFGCKHLQPPEAVAPGVVRVREAWDLHAVAVRANYYSEIMAVLSPRGRGTKGTVVEPSDRVIAGLMSRIPTYAAWPNLAWQRQKISSLANGWLNDSYDAAGHQRYHREAVTHLPESMLALSILPEMLTEKRIND